MIEVKDLCKVFKKPIRGKGFLGMVKSLFSFKYQRVEAVKGVSFTIADGETVGYIGANGAGKSTTIKMMCGILTPTSGFVEINGKRPYESRTRNAVLQSIGVVFGQRTQLWWDLPLVETFELLKQIYQIPKQEFEERFAFLRQTLGLDDFLSAPVRTLSLGQRMRADLCASMLHNPKVLFLDEPTIGLDVLVKRKLVTAIKDINERYNTTVILTTHDMQDIESLCSRIIIIDEGVILFDGKISELKKRFGDIRRVYFDSADEVVAPENSAVRLEVVEGKTCFVFDAEQVKIKDVLDYLIKNYSISDVKITETSVEDVVKRIYENKEY